MPRVLASTAMVAGLAGLAACGGSSAPTSLAPGTDSSTATTGTAPSCPDIPFRDRVTSGDLEQPALAAPASDAVRDGRFVTSLVLDDTLDVEPPHDGDVAAYSGDEALCEVLAGTLDNNGTVGRQPTDTIAFGLARVTLPDNMLSGHSVLGDATVESQGSVDGLTDVNPKLPEPSAYHDRLAWVGVVAPLIASSCPAMVDGESAPPDQSEPGHHGYQVFIVDAATGGDADLYTERRNGICPGSRPSGPFLGVPLTYRSLPWTLESVEPDRSSAQVSFDVTPCDGYSAVILADEHHGSATAQVVVERPFGPACGPDRHVVEKMRIATIGVPLPDEIEHGQTGAYAGP